MAPYPGSSALDQLFPDSNPVTRGQFIHSAPTANISFIFSHFSIQNAETDILSIVCAAFIAVMDS